MKAISREIIDRVVKEVERSFVAGEFVQARRMLRHFLRRKTTRRDRTRIQLLLGKSYLDEGKWREALESLQAARARAARDKDFKTVSSILNYIGDCCILKGDMSTANKYFNRSLRLCKEQGISADILARNISDLAQTAELQGEYRKALPRWGEAVGIYRTLSASREYAYALLNTAMLKSRLGKVDEAIADATNALSVLSGLGRKVALSDCLWLLGTLYAQKGEYSDGLDYMEKAVQESGGTGGLELVRAFIAYVGTLIEIGAFGQARQYGEEALAISRSLKWSRGAAICQVHLARVRLSEEDIVAALHYLREAKRQFNISGYLIGKARALIYEAEVRARTHNFKEAGRALEEAVSISRKTDDVILRSDCVVVKASILIAQKKFEQPVAAGLRQFCKQLKTAWRGQYLKAKYHLAALLLAGDRLEEVSEILDELLDESRMVLESLPARYRDSFRDHPLSRAMTELVLKLQMDMALQHISIDNVMSVVELFRERSPAGPGMGLAAPGYPAAELVYESEPMHELVGEAERVAPTRIPVLVTGETGVGKEMLARHIHARSGCGGQFVPLNCAALPHSLMESEMFGYKKGAFTGAGEDKEGLFLAAHQGTLFLDEVSSMPLEMQAKLLRVLEEGHVRPLGSTSYVVADVRLICATNSDLKEGVSRRRFREDLFYRINAVTLSVPPLRERREDIPVLLRAFLKAAGRNVRVEKKAIAALVGYDWPGNVRELKNEVARLLAVAGDRIEKHMLRTEILHPQVFAPTGGLAEMERKMIQEVLRRTGYNKQKAAKLLGISRTTLYDKIKRYRLEHTES